MFTDISRKSVHGSSKVHHAKEKLLLVCFIFILTFVTIFGKGQRFSTPTHCTKIVVKAFDNVHSFPNGSSGKIEFLECFLSWFVLSISSVLWSRSPPNLIESLVQLLLFHRSYIQACLDASIRWEKSVEDARCRICRHKSDDDNLLLCDGCNKAFHLYCLRPPLRRVPAGDWFCPSCRPASKDVERRRREARLARSERRRRRRADASSEEDEAADGESESNHSDQETVDGADSEKRTTRLSASKRPKSEPRPSLSSIHNSTTAGMPWQTVVSLLVFFSAKDVHLRIKPASASGQGCIFAFGQMAEHRHIFRRPTISFFLDFKLTFDSVDLAVLWRCPHLFSVYEQPRPSSHLRRCFTRIHLGNWCSSRLPSFTPPL